MPTKHSVYDSDTHFSINPVTRALKNESLAKTGVIQFDHNSERFTFEIPRHIEGHDMSECNIIQVHYNNIDAHTKEESRGVYEVTDMQISPDDEEVVILSWLISGNATKFVGSLNFLIRFSCTGDEGHLYYVWNTGMYTNISVSTGIYNGEAVVEDYADVLESWRKELEANQVVDMKQTTAGTGDGGVNIWTAYFGDGRTAAFEVRNGSKGDKGDKGDGAVVVVDSNFSTTSQNPIENRVLTTRLNGMSSTIGSIETSVNKMSTALDEMSDALESVPEVFDTIVDVPVDGWVQNGEPEYGGFFYVNSVTCEGITSGDTPIVDVLTCTGEPDSNALLTEAWSHIYTVYPVDDVLYLFAYECPEVNFEMKVKVVR